MEKLTMKVEGMTCGGCVKSIQNALSERDGIRDASADLDNGTVSVDFDPAVIEAAGIKTTIEDAGFDVVA